MSNDHIDADVTMKTTISWAMVLQIAAMLLPVAAVYATLTGNDRAMQAEITQLRLDQARLEANAKDMKTEIRADLQSIITEIRELRSEINKRK